MVKHGFRVLHIFFDLFLSLVCKGLELRCIKLPAVRLREFFLSLLLIFDVLIKLNIINQEEFDALVSLFLSIVQHPIYDLIAYF
jgi:hypothetical protein